MALAPEAALGVLTAAGWSRLEGPGDWLAPPPADKQPQPQPRAAGVADRAAAGAVADAGAAEPPTGAEPLRTQVIDLSRLVELVHGLG